MKREAKASAFRRGATFRGRHGVELLCIDLDGTLVGNPQGVARFARCWAALANGPRPKLCYNTSRTVANALANLPRLAVPAPDFIIGSLGSEIYDCHARFFCQEVARHLARRWNRAALVEAMQALKCGEPYPAAFSHTFKLSWRWASASGADLRGLKISLARRGLSVRLVYSGSRDLDVIPARSGKGPGLARLCRNLGIGRGSVLVGGDTNNDTSLIETPRVKSFVVANAHPELLRAALQARSYLCSQPMADGVIEALIHFGVCPSSKRATLPSLKTIRRPENDLGETEASLWRIIEWHQHSPAAPEAPGTRRFIEALFWRKPGADSSPWLRLLWFRALRCGGELLHAFGEVRSGRSALRRAQSHRAEIQRLCANRENILLIPAAFVWHAIDIDQAADAFAALQKRRGSPAFPELFWMPYLHGIGQRPPARRER